MIKGYKPVACPKGYVFIKETFEPHVAEMLKDRWTSAPTYVVRTPSYGLVTKEFWADLEAYQNLYLENPEKYIFDLESEAVPLDTPKDFQIWKRLANKYDEEFGGTEGVFKVYTLLFWSGDHHFDRFKCYIGVKGWELVENQ